MVSLCGWNIDPSPMWVDWVFCISQTELTTHFEKIYLCRVRTYLPAAPVLQFFEYNTDVCGPLSMWNSYADEIIIFYGSFRWTVDVWLADYNNRMYFVYFTYCRYRSMKVKWDMDSIERKQLPYRFRWHWSCTVRNDFIVHVVMHTRKYVYFTHSWCTTHGIYYTCTYSSICSYSLWVSCILYVIILNNWNKSWENE